MLRFHKKPAVLGIDVLSPKVSGEYSDEHFLQNLGSNSGNILFSEALYRCVKDAKRLTYHFDNGALDDCDVVIIAAANWINSSSDFGELADRLEQAKLPIVICGLGLQRDAPDEHLQVSDGTLRLLRLAQNSSGAIFARGDETASYLTQVLNLSCVVSTGCPSLLLAADGLAPRSIPARRSMFNRKTPRIGLHSTRHLWTYDAEGVHRMLYRQAIGAVAPLIIQSELPDILALGHGLDQHPSRKKAVAILERVYKKPFTKVQAYLRQNAVYEPRLDKWLDSLASLDGCLGTRVHGTIAALLAGTPAVLIVHDGRTAELAQRMRIPAVTAEQVMRGGLDEPLQYFDSQAQQDFYQNIEQFRAQFRTAFADVGVALN